MTTAVAPRLALADGVRRPPEGVLAAVCLVGPFLGVPFFAGVRAAVAFAGVFLPPDFLLTLLADSGAGAAAR